MRPCHRATAGDNVHKIWSDPDIAAVVICSETNRHYDLLLAAAKAGKHMFAEKPLGITAKESYAMADAIEKANLLFTTGYFMRTDPMHLFLKDEIAKGNFGKITRARGSNCHGGSLGGWFDQEWRWMADPKIAGVGAFGDLGTHKLDILMWLLGDVDSVTADIKVVTQRYGDCDESGEALIRFKNGVIGTLAAGWVDVDDPVQLLISGTEAHAAIVIVEALRENIRAFTALSLHGARLSRQFEKTMQQLRAFPAECRQLSKNKPLPESGFVFSKPDRGACPRHAAFKIM